MCSPAPRRRRCGGREGGLMMNRRQVTNRSGKAPEWHYLLWIGLTLLPLSVIVACVFLLPKVPPEAPKSGIMVSRGVLGLSANPYLKRQGGGSYRLLCPVASHGIARGDRHRRSCFDDRIWKMKGEHVTVRHGEPVTGGASKVVVCDVIDAKGKSLIIAGFTWRCA